MIAYLWLSAGVVAEAAGLVGMRASRGLRHPWMALLAFAGLLGSLALVGQALTLGMSLAVAYGVWTGSGIASAAVGGVALFGDHLSRRQAVGLVLILIGVVALNITGGH